MRSAKKKLFQDVTTKPTTDKQTINWTTIFLKQYISRLKKNQVLVVPGIFVTSRLSWSETLQKLIRL